MRAAQVEEKVPAVFVKMFKMFKMFKMLKMFVT